MNLASRHGPSYTATHFVRCFTIIRLGSTAHVRFDSSLQVLLLDEPTAGMDLSSRYQVWNLLKDGKAGRVTLFSTQFMDEADILAGKHCLSHCGRVRA